jgi:hypothetical protein
MLAEIKVKIEALRTRSKNLENDITKNLIEIIKTGTGIDVAISPIHLRKTRSRSKQELFGYTKHGFDYVDIEIIDEKGETVFGADLSLSYNEDEIRINTGCCGEFIVDSEDNFGKYQTKKYKLLGWIVTNIKEIKDMLDKYDLSYLDELNQLEIQEDKILSDIRKEEREKERKSIYDSILIGNKYETSDHTKFTVVKLTPKRVYIQTDFGYTRYDDNNDFINSIKNGTYKKIEE